MARTKAVLSAGMRLADYLSVSLLARVYPPELVNEILALHDADSQRIRSFPALTVGYYCIALSFYADVAYESVFACVTDGLAWTTGKRDTADTGSVALPPKLAKSSISAARKKLGYAPLQTLAQRACVPLACPTKQAEAFYQDLRIMAIDGSHFELADEAANDAAFGRPGSRTGIAAYPQAHCAVLSECATHAIIGANIGSYRSSEWSLCEPLLQYLTPEMLCLADRGFNGYTQWCTASQTGAQLLWRTTSIRQLPVVTMLPDGSYLSALYPDAASRKTREGEIMVRVIEYDLPGLQQAGLAANTAKGAKKMQQVRANKRAQTRESATDNDAMAQPDSAPPASPSANAEANPKAKPEQRYRLVTTLLDHERYPALELAAVYHERWEVEAVFDELKTHLGQRRRTLRSKTPDGVRQEFYGWVLAHYAVCWLMHQAANTHRIKQRTLSFTGNLQLFKRNQPRSGAFPPSATEK